MTDYTKNIVMARSIWSLQMKCKQLKFNFLHFMEMQFFQEKKKKFSWFFFHFYSLTKMSILTHFCPQNNVVNLLPMLAKWIVTSFWITFCICCVDGSTATRSRQTLSQWAWAQPTHRLHIRCRIDSDIVTFNSSEIDQQSAQYLNGFRCGKSLCCRWNHI